MSDTPMSSNRQCIGTPLTFRHGQAIVPSGGTISCTLWSSGQHSTLWRRRIEERIRGNPVRHLHQL